MIVGDKVEVILASWGGPPRRGVIVGEDEDVNVGQVFIVEFPSGHTSRLTERELVRHEPDA